MSEYLGYIQYLLTSIIIVTSQFSTSQNNTSYIMKIVKSENLKINKLALAFFNTYENVYVKLKKV